jgi:hypothetical protein
LIDLYAQGGTANAIDLKIYNINGGGVASVSKGVKEKKEIMHPIVYPNPSNSNFNIKFNKNGNALVYAYVFDLKGFPLKKIESILNSDNQVINWDGYMENGSKANEGVYIIKGFYNEEMFDAKLIVN